MAVDKSVAQALGLKSTVTQTGYDAAINRYKNVGMSLAQIKAYISAGIKLPTIVELRSNPVLANVKNNPSFKSTKKDTKTDTSKTNNKTSTENVSTSAIKLASQFLGKTYVQQDPKWSSQPEAVRKEAYRILQNPTASELADMVQRSGMSLEYLQNNPVWTQYPMSIRTPAFEILKNATKNTTDNTNVNTKNNIPKKEVKPTTQAPSQSVIENSQRFENAYKVIDSSGLPSELQDVFRSIVDAYGPNDQINYETIISKVRQNARTTIDPYFQEQARQLESDLIAARDFQAMQREMEVERERAEAGLAIRQAKDSLEASGLTFSGKAVETLGEKSAYARPDSPEAAQSAIPTQVSFGGPDTGMFYEGTVNQANRLIQTSSAAKYAQNMQALGRSAEEKLGTSSAIKMNIPGFNVVGGIKGDLENQRQKAIGDLFNQMVGVEQAKIGYKQPINYNYNTSI